MSKNIIQLNEEVVKNELKELVRNSVEETLNESPANARSGRRYLYRLLLKRVVYSSLKRVVYSS